MADILSLLPSHTVGDLDFIPQDWFSFSGWQWPNKPFLFKILLAVEVKIFCLKIHKC